MDVIQFSNILINISLTNHILPLSSKSIICSRLVISHFFMYKYYSLKITFPADGQNEMFLILKWVVRVVTTVFDKVNNFF
jgi:hypothetical protein